MHKIKILLAISAALMVVTAILIQPRFAAREADGRVGDDVATDSNNMDTNDSQTYSEARSEEPPLSQETRDSISSLIPLEALAWAADRGYHAASENGQITKRPYEYYDQETLEQLAIQGDGLAQLILAERLSFSDPQQADMFYVEAAINGKTAGLSNGAGDRLLIVPGQKGYGFPISDEEGGVSDEYLEVLKFYAAAEYLGDFVGTVMLSAHLETSGLGNSPGSIRRICASGEEFANAIRAERNRRWGSAGDTNAPIEWAELPGPICRQP